MNRSSAQLNIESLTHVAQHFQELCDEVIFVGGCVTGLLITDKAAPDVRFTVDVDCIINVITIASYHSMADKLRQKGFKEIPVGNHPICRWECSGIYVDIMPVEKDIFGFTNKWYKEAISNAIEVNISDSIKINVISAPYFLATKLEAFKDRGKNNYLLSHDLEDIISLIDGRPEILSDLEHTTIELKNIFRANSRF